MRSFPRQLYAHARFVLAEFNSQRANVGLGAAASFLRMRGLSPFGAGRAWQLANDSDSASARELCDSGFCELRPRSADEVGRLVDHYLKAMERRERRAFATLGEYFEYARAAGTERPPGVLATAQADCVISQLARNPDLIRLAEQYLKLPATRLVGGANIDALVRLDRPGPATGYDNALRFHRDVDAYRFLKIFIYLTDCWQGDGHHEIFLRSHRHYPARLGPIGRYELSDIQRHIPEATLKRVEGAAGYTFAENTFAFHRGTPPQRHDRLICNLQYMEDGFMKLHPGSFRLV